MKGDAMATKGVGDQQLGRFEQRADFIRAQPESMSAREIAEAAAKAGLKISVNHVYNLRAAAAKKADPGLSGVVGLSTRRRVGRPSSAAIVEDVEQRLRLAIAEIGLQRARQIFETIEAAFGRTRGP